MGNCNGEIEYVKQNLALLEDKLLSLVPAFLFSLGSCTVVVLKDLNFLQDISPYSIMLQYF